MRRSLTLVSATALFLELALIRWLAGEVRILSYFKNLVLVACFLGFGLGMYRSRKPSRLGAAIATTVVLVAAVSLPLRWGSAWGPESASIALSGFADAMTQSDTAGAAESRPLSLFAIGLAWAALLFLGCQVVLHGYAQRMGADFAAFGQERRIEAYSWNVLGSLLGVAAFGIVSWLALPPAVWFAAPVLASVPFFKRGLDRVLVVLAALALCGLLWPEPWVVWSPYQRVELDSRSGCVTVNRSGYMFLRSFVHAPTPSEKAGVDRWRLPHTVRPGASSVLIVGAGGGNDVAAALHAGARKVVAVEIDPIILAIGRGWHPEQPYSNDRVRVVVDDARHFGEATDETFDLVVFSHVDAHGALSALTNVRLDNFLHTVESFRTFAKRLAPGGTLYVSFQCVQLWVADRLRENLTVAFGEPPAMLLARNGEHWLAHFVAGSPAAKQRALEVGKTWFLPPSTGAIGPSTDDWPYLYARERAVPRPMLVLATIVAVLAAATVILLVREARAPGTPERAGTFRHFFGLGAAFLLVEVHNVGKLARVFGTTWWVNAWVISGVLVVILLANLVASRFPAVTGRRLALLGALVATLGAGALVPVEAILAAAGPLGAAAFYSSPLFFSGLIFAGSFRDAENAERALGANILGAVLGGFLETASFVVGLRGLLAIAALIYVASWRGETKS